MQLPNHYSPELNVKREKLDRNKFVNQWTTSNNNVDFFHTSFSLFSRVLTAYDWGFLFFHLCLSSCACLLEWNRFYQCDFFCLENSQNKICKIRIILISFFISCIICFLGFFHSYLFIIVSFEHLSVVFFVLVHRLCVSFLSSLLLAYDLVVVY